MKTIHLIFNAHLDPIWLWPWQAGLDEALATCRSAADRLDANPDLTFARGEAWVYQQIERLDPALFERIRRLVKTGRWEIVGGWWIQPDCNLPSGFAWRKQIELGREYFMDRFGLFPRLAWNVDSFGHAASLPNLLHEFKQDRYVMMRPQEHEMTLPARMFRWRGREGGPQITVFRIARAYAMWQPSLDHVKQSLNDLPEGIDHTMAFVGVGDHGGGPTQQMVEWCRENATAINGAKMIFSTPSRFFDAIADKIETLPLVTGELQHHAIGCFSVHRPVKVLVRKAEHMLQQATIMAEHDARPEPDASEQLKAAWQRICFHHFHDTFGGTCIPSAYEQVHAQIQQVIAFADESLHYGLRRRLADLPDDPLQRIVFFNASDAPFDGYVQIEPWMGWRKWQSGYRIIDEQGKAIPYQLMHSEAITNNIVRFALRIAVKPAEQRVLRIDTTGGAASAAAPAVGTAVGAASAAVSAVTVATPIGGHDLTNGVTTLSLGPSPRMRFADHLDLPLPELHLLEDPTDTWSHAIDRYTEGPAESPRWNFPTVLDTGPLMASMIQTGTIGQSTLTADWRIYADEPFVELILRIHWMACHQILKLVLPMPSPLLRRWDGIPGDGLERKPDGRELPLRDRTLLELSTGQRIGIVCPDIYAIDALPHRVRLTLLRSAIMAHHDPNPGTWPRSVVSDQGEHEFRFRFFAGSITGEQLDTQALMLQRPLIVAELTRGMPTFPYRLPVT